MRILIDPSRPAEGIISTLASDRGRFAVSIADLERKNGNARGA